LLYNNAVTLSIGETLRQRRQENKLSLEQVAQQTRIRLHYLEALEAGNLDQIPSSAQARGFLRTYAQFLKIDPQLLLSSLNNIEDLEPSPLPDSPPAIENPHASHAEAILLELGAKLRQQRELLGLSLEDVERHTHIRPHYLKALEAGKLVDLPSPVQGRGMLSNYAIFLGFDPEPLLLRFAEGLQANLAARQALAASLLPAKTRKPARGSGRLRSFFSIDLLAGVFLIVFIVGFVIWGALRISNTQSDLEPTQTSPSIAEVLVPDTATPTLSPTAEPTFAQTPAPTDQDFLQGTAMAELGSETAEAPVSLPGEVAQPTATNTLVPFNASSVQIYIVVRQRGWVKVTVDGQVEFEGRVVPGSAYLFSGNELVEILTGNGAAIQVYFNQQDQGALGAFGEVVQRSYTPAGVIEPTAIPTLAPTFTPEPSLTVTPTPTATLEP
jgi:cytoskeleton protein RodZ